MNQLKQIVKKSPLLREAALWARWRLVAWKYDPAYWIGRIVRRPDALFVQIGSNDGLQNDPLHKVLEKRESWIGLFVEPVPYLFDRLRRNYGDSPRYKFANVAVNSGEAATFYWVDPSAKRNIPDLPYWYDQLGSFNRNHILNHLDGVLEPYIVSREIEGVTLADLLNREGIRSIDVLHIDTEGWDWRILSQLDLEKFDPQVVLYEHGHLRAHEKEDSIRFLEDRFDLYDLGRDIIAINKKAHQDQGVRSRLRALRNRRVSRGPAVKPQP